MWDLANHTPFPAEAGFQRDETAAAFWCVWLKATFAIRPGQPLQFVADQPPLVRNPVYAQAPGQPPLLQADCDITLPKPACDVILDGIAEAPDGHDPAQPFPVTLRLGPLSRTLLVHPPRRVEGGRVTMLPPCPASLGHDETWGGPGHPVNPAGRGHGVQAAEPLLLPRLCLPGQDPVRGPTDAVSFGAIPADWPTRVALGGTYDAAWQRNRAPLLPRDHDPRARQSAPEAQQMQPAPIGGEQITLQNIGPNPGTGGTFGFALPSLRFDLETRLKGQPHAHPMTMQTIHINMTTGRLSITWAGALAVPGAHNDVALAGSRLHLARAEGFTVAPEAIDRYHDLLNS